MSLPRDSRIKRREYHETTPHGNDLTCPSCIVKIEKHLGLTPGVKRVKVCFNTSRIEVDQGRRIGSGRHAY